MATTPRAVDTYAAQLIDLGLGLPLWHPEPIDEEGIRVGDVGMVQDGKFIRLFNAMCEATDPINIDGVPEGFVPLRVHPTVFPPPTPSYLPPGPIINHTSVSYSVSGGVTVDPLGAGAEYNFSASTDKAALAMLHGPGDQSKLTWNSTFPSYMKRHHKSWVALARGFGWLMEDEDIVLVSGWIKTSAWALAACTANASSHKISFGVPAGGPVSARFAVSMAGSSPIAFDQRIGPSIVSTDASFMKRNQCIFLTYYKFRMRMWHREPMLNVSVETKDAMGPSFFKTRLRPYALLRGYLPRGRREDVGSQEISGDVDDGGEIVEVPGSASSDDLFHDPLDAILDYILESSDCDSAIASHEDLYTLYKRYGVSSSLDLQKILSEDGPQTSVNAERVGTISRASRGLPKDLVVKILRYLVYDPRPMSTDWDTNAPNPIIPEVLLDSFDKKVLGSFALLNKDVAEELRQDIFQHIVIRSLQDLDECLKLSCCGLVRYLTIHIPLRDYHSFQSNLPDLLRASIGQHLRVKIVISGDGSREFGDILDILPRMSLLSSDLVESFEFSDVVLDVEPLFHVLAGFKSARWFKFIRADFHRSLECPSTLIGPQVQLVLKDCTGVSSVLRTLSEGYRNEAAGHLQPVQAGAYAALTTILSALSSIPDTKGVLIYENQLTSSSRVNVHTPSVTLKFSIEPRHGDITFSFRWVSKPMAISYMRWGDFEDSLAQIPIRGLPVRLFVEDEVLLRQMAPSHEISDFGGVEAEVVVGGPNETINELEQLYAKLKPATESEYVIIGVMGTSGISTFVDLISESNVTWLEELREDWFDPIDIDISCGFEMYGNVVQLIHIPSHVDRGMSSDRFQRFSKNSYLDPDSLEWSGVIYMLDLQDIPVIHDVERDFAILRKLCGDEALKNVAIVTTMWPEVSPGVRDAYEPEPRESDLFKPVLDGGATMVQHDGSLASAQTILRRVIDNPPLKLHIQREFTEVCEDIMRMIADDEVGRHDERSRGIM